MWQRFKIFNFKLKPRVELNQTKVGKWMSLCCTLVYQWIAVTDGVKFQFNDKINLYTKKDSEQRRPDSL